jgi:hypothetical protein
MVISFDLLVLSYDIFREKSSFFFRGTAKWQGTEALNWESIVPLSMICGHREGLF